MNFPKYTRAENRSCKLSSSDIDEIIERRKKGETCKSIAKDFDVSAQTVWIWGIDRNLREEIRKKRKNYQIICKSKEWFKKNRIRKKSTHPEIRQYEKEKAKELRKKRGREWTREYAKYLYIKQRLF